MKASLTLSILSLLAQKNKGLPCFPDAGTTALSMRQRGLLLPCGIQLSRPLILRMSLLSPSARSFSSMRYGVQGQPQRWSPVLAFFLDEGM